MKYYTTSSVQKKISRATTGYQKLTILNCAVLQIFQCNISFLNDIIGHTNLEIYYATNMNQSTEVLKAGLFLCVFMHIV